CLVFLYSASHRALHSFPTRRSSDLKRSLYPPRFGGGAPLTGPIGRCHGRIVTRFAVIASTFFPVCKGTADLRKFCGTRWPFAARDRKSTRLNSSHVSISYAVFCLKK